MKIKIHQRSHWTKSVFSKQNSTSRTHNHFLAEHQDLSGAAKPSKAPRTDYPTRHPGTRQASQKAGTVAERVDVVVGRGLLRCQTRKSVRSAGLWGRMWRGRPRQIKVLPLMMMFHL